MKKEVKYCPMCKKSETRDECSYGPKVWDTLSMNEQVISEGRKRDHLANAVLGLSFAASALQSPSAFINSGKIEGPGIELMSRMMKRRGEANRNLDSGRVSHPARNRKKIEVKEGLKQWWDTGRNQRVPNENKATWKELMKDDMKQLTRTDSAFKTGATGIRGWRPHKAFSPKMVKTGPTPAVRQAVERPIRAIKRIAGAKLKEDLKIDKKTLMMLMIKKLMDEKKRKNYLLNYGYIGEAKTPAWSRNEGKDLKKGGLNRKGIASYRRQHPGSKLSMAVTTEPSKLKKGSKSWKRRKSFCSRMSGVVGPMKDEKGRPTRKALSLRKWNC
jgi:hypothetical protein